MTIRIGSNQYFLRVRRKAQNSLRNEIIWFHASELVDHAFSGWSGWLTLDPVRSGLRLPCQPERIFPEQAKQESYGSYHQIEQESGDNGSDDAAEQQPEFGPNPIERVQPNGAHSGRRQD